jgi:superfamily II DNA or RNA helicase
MTAFAPMLDFCAPFGGMPLAGAAVVPPPLPVAGGRFGPLIAMPFGGTGYSPRDYQREDVLATLRAWAGGARGVILKEGTGLGKSVIVAELARRLSRLGRVLVVVDVGILAGDLYRTIERHTGRAPGVLTGDAKDGWRTARVVVCTVQTLYAGGDGAEWFRQLDPADFVAVLVDECETSIAEKYSGAVRYFLNGNPDLVIAGLSATPRRGDGRGMGELYDYANAAPGPLNRGILWGRDNGWTVHVRQAFVRVSIDFSSLKLRKDEDGEKDYSEADLLKLFDTERALVELAHGIHEAAAEKPAIVICPNSVEFAKALSHHLDACRRGCANAVYGTQGRRCDDLLAAFKHGDYPYVVSVNKLYKGFDADRVRWVFMCRKTRSPRLYEQAMGRGVRTLEVIRDSLNAEPDPWKRREIVAASDKPHMVMADLVGLDESVKDMGVIDILAGDLSARARARAKKKMIAGEGEQEAEDAGRDAESEIAAEEAKTREEAERRKRRLVQVKADVQVEYSDDLRAGAGAGGNAATARINPSIPAGQERQLHRFGVSDDEIRRMPPDLAKRLSAELTVRNLHRLATWKQCKALIRRGYTKGQLHAMTKNEAREILDEIADREGWRKKGDAA